MNRNCLFNKALALLLCAVLLVGYLPSIALPAAAASDEFEGEMDIVETTTAEPTTPPEGSEGNPIVLNELENRLEIAAETTVYYSCYARFNGSNMTVSGDTGYFVHVGEEATQDVDGAFSYENVTADRFTPFVFAIQNATANAVTYQVNFTFPAGSSNNPEVIGADWDYTATLEAGNQEGYYYTYTATQDGTLQIIVSNESGWQYSITNNTTSANDTHTSEDGAAYTYESAVTAGDEISIIVNTYDSANPYTAPAGSVTVRVQYKPGTAPNPIFLSELVNNVNVPAGQTVYYHGNFSGMLMTVTGAGNYIYNGESAEIDGVAVAVSSGNMWSKDVVIAIQNTGDADADYTISFAYPQGHHQNPEEIGPGLEYTAKLEDGNDQGYYFTYTAEKTGILMVYVSVPEDATGYGFAINNLTTGVAEDEQWSDMSPINPYSLNVTAGDEIVIKVCTWDPANWAYPAGEVTVKIEYKPGTEANPIFLPELVNNVNVPAGETVYYHGNFSGMMMTVGGTGNYIYGGEIQEIDGTAVAVDSGSFWSKDIVVAIQNTGDADADYTISFVYPLGSKSNPAAAVLGDNNATVAEGTDGYFFTYTAEKTGTLVMTMPAGNWQYTVNNLTTGVIGDLQDSSMDPVVNPYELEVTAGDEIEINVNTFNPEDVWTAPAGSVSFNLAYKAFARLATADVSLDADIRLVTNFDIDPALLNAEGAYLVVSKSGGLGITEKTIYMSDLKAQGTNAAGYYRIETNLAAAELTCEVTYTAYDGEGNIILIKKGKNGTPSENIVYSALEYVETVLKGSNQAKKALMKGLLVYGGYAQRYFSFNTENLAYDLLTKYGYEIPTCEDVTLETVDKYAVKSTGDLAVAKGLTPGLDSAIYLKVSFALKQTSSIENVSAVITKKAPNGNTFTETVTEFEYNEANGRYMFILTDIPAALLDYTYNVTFTDSVTGETGQIDVSVLSWVRAALKGTNTNNQMFARAIYYYNQAANEFFGL